LVEGEKTPVVEREEAFALKEHCSLRLGESMEKMQLTEREGFASAKGGGGTRLCAGALHSESPSL